MSRHRRPVSDFWKLVKKTDGCWTWTEPLDRGGNGRFKIGGVVHLAHRFSWTMKYGLIPYYHQRNQMLFVCHHCDNPACVRPDHLFLGTNVDNLHDRDRKGRGPVGIRNGRSKLSEANVLDIKERLKKPVYGTKVGLAREYGVGTTTIQEIAHGLRWGHV